MSKKIAIYPGSFNPFHRGHYDILIKACELFDTVIVAKLINPDKPLTDNEITFDGKFSYDTDKVKFITSYSTIMEIVKQYKANAIVRGLRNTNDFVYEQGYQYWCEDLSVNIPFVYIISDRKYLHYSSSAIRQLNMLKKSK